MTTYECENCGRKEEAGAEGAKVPECCGRPMRGTEKLPVCELSETAEHSRLDATSDACDDGRAGS
jgi:hypothetical protein